MPNQNLQAIRLDKLDPKAQEAFYELLCCVSEGLTGDLRIDFKEGVPMVVKRTEVRRFGKAPIDNALDKR